MTFDALEAALPGWLETRRWFADKGRGIARAEIEDAHIEAVDDDSLILAIVHVTFRRGDPARYLVPVAWTEEFDAAETIASASPRGGAGAYIDGVDAPWFGRWLIGALQAGPGGGGQGWAFSLQPAAHEILEAARQVPATVMRAEQTNTSLRYGDTLMLKLVRRLQPGPNPDEEMLRALAGVGFDRVPPYVGGASWRGSDGETYPVALAQAFVPNLGDGWTWMLQRLHELAERATIPELGTDSPEWLLGRRTAELHVALARVADPALAPESANAAAIEADVSRVDEAVAQTISLLRAGAAGLPASLRESLPAIIARLRDAASCAAGFRAEAESQRIRVHGDYHLGQTLRTPDDDWVIIDFEGEPARPVAERRQKTSALKDVAGMLRSFAYARGAAERERLGEPVMLAAWESAARRAFLDGYQDVIGDAFVPLVPAENAAFTDALAAWEIDKALYEVAYEVRNRPDWVELPLHSLFSNGHQ